MEMTYDGALVMPKNFAIVDEEEMTYVDGGAGIPNWVVAGAINLGISIILGGISGGLKSVASAANKAALGKHFSQAAIKELTRIGMAYTAAAAVTGIFSAIMTFIGAIFDPGSYIANQLDARDKNPNNGWVNW